MFDKEPNETLMGAERCAVDNRGDFFLPILVRVL